VRCTQGRSDLCQSCFQLLSFLNLYVHKRAVD
jgi:hypothetical protein